METPPNYVTVAGFRRSPSKDFHLRLDARINRRDGRVDTQIFSAWIEQPRSSMCTRAITAEERPWKVNVSLAAVGWQSELDARISAPSVPIALCRRRRRSRQSVGDRRSCCWFRTLRWLQICYIDRDRYPSYARSCESFKVSPSVPKL